MAVTAAVPDAETDTARTPSELPRTTKHPKMMFRLGVAQISNGVLAVLLMIFAIASLGWDDKPLFLSRISAICSVPLFIHSLATGVMHIFTANGKLKRKRCWVFFTATMTILASAFNGVLIFMAIITIYIYPTSKNIKKTSSSPDRETDGKETMMVYVSSLRIHEAILAANYLELLVGVIEIVTSSLSVGLYLCGMFDL